jgi:hypothetical protein
MEPIRCSYCNSDLTGQSHYEHNGLVFCQWICFTLMFPEVLQPHKKEIPSRPFKKKRAKKSDSKNEEDINADKYTRKLRRKIDWGAEICLASIDKSEKPRPLRRPGEPTSNLPPIPLGKYFDAIKSGTYEESC